MHESKFSKSSETRDTSNEFNLEPLNLKQRIHSLLSKNKEDVPITQKYYLCGECSRGYRLSEEILSGLSIEYRNRLSDIYHSQNALWNESLNELKKSILSAVKSDLRKIFFKCVDPSDIKNNGVNTANLGKSSILPSSLALISSNADFKESRLIDFLTDAAKWHSIDLEITSEYLSDSSEISDLIDNKISKIQQGVHKIINNVIFKSNYDRLTEPVFREDDWTVCPMDFLYSTYKVSSDMGNMPLKKYIDQHSQTDDFEDKRLPDPTIMSFDKTYRQDELIDIPLVYKEDSPLKNTQINEQKEDILLPVNRYIIESPLPIVDKSSMPIDDSPSEPLDDDSSDSSINSNNTVFENISNNYKINILNEPMDTNNNLLPSSFTKVSDATSTDTFVVKNQDLRIKTNFEFDTDEIDCIDREYDHQNNTIYGEPIPLPPNIENSSTVSIDSGTDIGLDIRLENLDCSELFVDVAMDETNLFNKYKTVGKEVITEVPEEQSHDEGLNEFSNKSGFNDNAFNNNAFNNNAFNDNAVNYNAPTTPIKPTYNNETKYSSNLTSPDDVLVDLTISDLNSNNSEITVENLADFDLEVYRPGEVEKQRILEQERANEASARSGRSGYEIELG